MPLSDVGGIQWDGNDANDRVHKVDAETNGDLSHPCKSYSCENHFFNGPIARKDHKTGTAATFQSDFSSVHEDLQCTSPAAAGAGSLRQIGFLYL